MRGPTRKWNQIIIKSKKLYFISTVLTIEITLISFWSFCATHLSYEKGHRWIHRKISSHNKLTQQQQGNLRKKKYQPTKICSSSSSSFIPSMSHSGMQINLFNSMSYSIFLVFFLFLLLSFSFTFLIVLCVIIII